MTSIIQSLNVDLLYLAQIPLGTKQDLIQGGTWLIDVLDHKCPDSHVTGHIANMCGLHHATFNVTYTTYCNQSRVYRILPAAPEWVTYVYCHSMVELQ